MFEANDKVVVSGYREAGEPSGQHRYGTNGFMKAWEKEGTVLTVESVDEQRPVVYAGCADRTYSFAPSELRYATKAECNTPFTPLPKGTILLLTADRGVVVIISDGVDDDDEYFVKSLLDDDQFYIHAKGDDFTVTGKIDLKTGVPHAA